MNKLAFLVFAAVISDCRGQGGFALWCPDLATGLSNCATQHLSGLPTISSHLSDPNATLSFQKLMSNVLTEICQESTKVKNYYGCVSGVYACIPADWARAFLNGDQMKRNVDIFCNNINNIDIPCLSDVSRQSAAATCVNNSAQGVHSSNLVTADALVAWICGLYPSALNCYKSVFETCPLKTADILAEVIVNSKPIGCSACKTAPSLILLVFLFITLCVKGRFN